MSQYLFTFVGALAISAIATLLARQLALRSGFVDHPGPHKIHRIPVPLLGGVAIYAAVLISMLLMIDASVRSHMLGVFAAATLLTIVGTLDDRGLLHHQVKLLVFMPAAAIILIALGTHVALFSSLLSLSCLPSSASGFLLVADYALTFFWVVGITAAFSILDHMDGLCAGVAAVASIFFCFFGVFSGQVLVGMWAAATLGASLGFLRWNFNPAKIFMGDGGAMFLGFTMATLGVKISTVELSQDARWIIPVLILGVPIFDTTLVSISRARRGLIPFASPGKDHTAHRLANLGLGERGAVLVLYILAILFGVLALLVSHLSVRGVYVLTGMVILGATAAVILLEHAPYERQSNPRKPI